MLMDNENYKSRRRISIYRVNTDDQMIQCIEILLARFPDTELREHRVLLSKVYTKKRFSNTGIVSTLKTVAE